MVPPRNDPRWRTVVTNKETPRVENLATMLMLMRAKQMLIFEPERVDEAIELAHGYFTKNESMCRADLAILFGGKS